MQHKIFHTLAIGCLFVVQAAAQLSPGDLARSHAHLEGISNCTQCHTFGEKISNEKCLACHTEIDSRVDNRQGYHASREVRGKECASCHSDHHGRNFDMVRFDQENFKHRLTGYELTGAHAKVDCRACHQPDFITDRELKKRAETFLGLGTACIDCHDDYHQQTLDRDCAKCHSTEAFAPAANFDHNQTDYPLTGQHVEVACKQCHPVVMRAGQEFQRFADVPFANCNSCHDDPHRNNLGTDCKQCHTEQSFTSHSGLRRFKHASTGFPLRGRHQRVDCFACHQPDASPASVFQQNIGTRPDNCVACHEDVHDGKFGPNCAECHTEEGFRMGSNSPRLDQFDHDLTGFALEGKHEVVDCRKCHVSESLTDPLPHSTCASCHMDYHEGEFAAGATAPDCAECHSVAGFSPSQFTLDDHATSNFPLDGAHLATPCFSCHLDEGDGKWHFRKIGTRCVDCHDNVHTAELAEKFYPEENCQQCHVTDSWTGTNHFDHAQTAFPLTGGHLQATCAQCHLTDEPVPKRQFAGISQDCAACHDNVHGTQFAQAGVTDCRRCHGFEGWAAEFFDHGQSRFPLEGKHAEVACDRCHQSELVNGEPVVIYRLEKFECVDCHQ